MPGLQTIKRWRLISLVVIYGDGGETEVVLQLLSCKLLTGLPVIGINFQGFLCEAFMHEAGRLRMR